MNPVRLAWALGLVAAGHGCGEDRAVRIQLQLHASCLPTTQYDVSCMQALRLDVLDARGALVGSTCTDVAGRYATMQNLLAEPDGLLLMAEVRPRAGVRLELRGYHVIDKAPCTDLRDEELMLWGSSRSVDLDDEALRTVAIEAECRPGCDCSALQGITQGTGPCVPALSPGACAPAVNQLCRAECDDDHDCYGNLMTCGDRRCTPEPTALCAACEGDGDCASGLCVENTATGERFCASACPPLPDVAPCPLWMSCKALGGGPWVRVVGP